MEHRLNQYLEQIDRDYEIAEEKFCICREWPGDNPDCPAHGEEACWARYELWKNMNDSDSIPDDEKIPLSQHNPEA